MKYTLLIAIFALVSINAKAQAPDWQWAVQSINYVAGGGEYQFAVPNQICHDNHGNIYMLGGSNRNLVIKNSQIKVDSSTVGNIFLAKFNPEGKALWIQQTFDSSEQSLSTGGGVSTGIGSDLLNNTCIMAMDSNGHCYVCSNAKKNVNLGNGIIIGSGPYIICNDSDGNILWAKNIGKMIGSNPAGRFWISSIAVDRVGSIYITGSFFDSLLFQNLLLVSENNVNIFIAKFDNSGNAEWAKEAQCIQNADRGDGLGICVSNIGENTDVYITGKLESDSSFFDDKFIGNKNNTNQVFLTKYNDRGIAQWVRSSNDQPGINCSGYETAITSDALGNIYLCGQFQADSGFFGDHDHYAIEPRNEFDPYHSYIVKFNPFGNTQWAKQIDSYNDDNFSKVFASNIIVDNKLNIYLSGAINGRSNYNGIETGFSDPKDVTNLFVLQCDSNGRSNWVLTSGAESIKGGIDTYLYSSEVFCNGYLYVSGAFSSSMILGSTHLITSDPQQHTLFLAKLGNTPSAVNSNSKSIEKSFSLFPNPASSQATLNFTLEKSVNVSIQFFDLLGRQIKQNSLGELSAGEHSEEIDLREVPNGTYVCRINRGDQISTQIFTVVK